MTTPATRRPAACLASRLALAAGLALATAGLTACDEGPAVTVNFTQGGNVWDDFAYAAQKGPVLVEIHGNPVAPRTIEVLVQMVREELKSAVMGRVVEFTVYPEEAPAHRVAVDGFWIDAKQVTNAEFRRFVKATGYETVAERAPLAEDYPGALPELLVPGSVVFDQPDQRVSLNNHYNWWGWKAGANWRPR